MNVVLAENLYQALKQVKRTNIHALPVLNHVKMEFTNGELYLTTTNLDKPLQSKCACRINEEWSTCVLMVHKIEEVIGYMAGYGVPIYAKHKAYPFFDFVKLHAEYKDVLLMEFIPETQMLIISVQGERSKSEFKCLDAMEFPVC